MNHALSNDLAALREPAPDTVLPGVLVGTGLADEFVIRSSPLGPVYVAFNDRGVSCLDLAATPEAFQAACRKRLGRSAFPAAAPPDRLLQAIDRAVAEGRPGGLTLDLRAVSDFQGAVLRKTAEIPAGEIRPYGWVAREIGKPGSTRAVGTALAGNPVPLIVPCHRVVRADGQFGRYSLGEDANKRRLLEHEGIDPGEVESLAGRGVRFVGSDTTHIFCFPTCRDARRITDAHRVEFRNEADAADTGYRPCKRCRPAAVAA
jgi:O-6-methylguanine DNA methyltransferase